VSAASISPLRVDRSSTDPVSNATLLSPVELEEHLGSIIESTLPLHCLPAFLHEATHHWCFFSPVGSALACLAHRARRRAVLLALGEAPELDPWDIIDDLIRYRAGTEALRPFAEGLALFAELDDVPGDSPLGSDVMLSAALCFLLGRDVPDDELLLGRPLVALLHQARRRKLSIDRKTTLLLQPFKATREHGYLPGYFIVKSLWLGLWTQTERLADADLALQYLSQYVYGDYALVASLLDPDVKDIFHANTIPAYVVERIQRLLQADHERNLDLLESAAGLPFRSDYDAPVPEPSNLGSDPELWELGRRRLDALIDELREEAAHGSGVKQAIAHRDLALLAQRELLCIGRAEVEVRVSDSGWVTVWKDGRLVHGGPGLGERNGTRSGTGSLQVFLNPWPWGRYLGFTVTVGDEMVQHWFSRELSEAARRQFDAYRTNLALLDEESRLLDEVVAEQLEDDEYVLDIVGESLEHRLDEVYTQIALGHLDPPARTAAIEKMRERGLYRILGSAALVRALAWTSVASRTGASVEELAAEFAEARDVHRNDDDFAVVVERIQAAAQEGLGDPLIYEDGGRLVCTV
jgi:hypothetical protein